MRYTRARCFPVKFATGLGGLVYQQAADKGWQVKKGEKSTMIVKVV